MELPLIPAPGTVLVGYDGSEHAEEAVRWAADEATLDGRPLTLVHVLAPLSGFEVSALASTWISPEDVRAAARQEGAEMLRAVRGRLQANMPELEVELCQVTGDPRQVLLEHSAAASSLFVGSRGRGPVRALLLGSVGVAVSRAAQCPTFVIRPYRHPGERQGVLVGTDCSEHSVPTLELAYRQASLRRMPLTVVHSIGTLGPERGVGLIADDAPGYDEPRRRLAEVVAPLAEKFPEVRVGTRLAHGIADHCLIELSAQMDLVVVGHHAGVVAGDLVGVGSFATPVVERADCPVVVVAGRRPA